MSELISGLQRRLQASIYECSYGAWTHKQDLRLSVCVQRSQEVAAHDSPEACDYSSVIQVWVINRCLRGGGRGRRRRYESTLLKERGSLNSEINHGVKLNQ